jgi:hypothetical protein
MLGCTWHAKPMGCQLVSAPRTKHCRLPADHQGRAAALENQRACPPGSRTFTYRQAERTQTVVILQGGNRRWRGLSQTPPLVWVPRRDRGPCATVLGLDKCGLAIPASAGRRSRYIHDTQCCWYCSQAYKSMVAQLLACSDALSRAHSCGAHLRVEPNKSTRVPRRAISQQGVLIGLAQRCPPNSGRPEP